MSSLQVAIDNGYHFDCWSRITGETFRLTSRNGYSIMARIGRRDGHINEVIGQCAASEFDKIAFPLWVQTTAKQFSADTTDMASFCRSLLVGPAQCELRIHDNWHRAFLSWEARTFDDASPYFPGALKPDTTFYVSLSNLSEPHEWAAQPGRSYKIENRRTLSSSIVDFDDSFLFWQMMTGLLADSESKAGEGG